jgi:hypothetical protein
VPDREQCVAGLSKRLKLSALPRGYAVACVEQVEEHRLLSIKVLDLDHPAVPLLVEGEPIDARVPGVGVAPIKNVRTFVIPHELVGLEKLSDFLLPFTLAHENAFIKA